MDLLIVGNAMTDYVYRVEKSVLQRLGLVEGGEREDISEEELKRALAGHELLDRTPGGSAVNCGIAAKLLGLDVGVVGTVGSDEDGERYSAMLDDYDVQNFLAVREGEESGRAYTLLTGSERSFAVYLNAAPKLNLDVQALTPEIVHTSIYAVDANRALIECLEEFHTNQATVSLDLANPHSVLSIGEDITRLLAATDVLFCSPAEFAAAAPKGSSYFWGPESFGLVCKKYGAHGADLFQAENIEYIPAVPTNEVNVNGAGDNFAGGILYGVANNLNLITMGKLASKMGSLCVGQESTRLSKEKAEEAFLYAGL